MHSTNSLQNRLISKMASQNPPFQSRSSFGGNLGKLPDRSLGGTHAQVPFGTSTTQQARENARLEREREKAEKERQEREELNNLSEEQRDEIREAVNLLFLLVMKTSLHSKKKATTAENAPTS